MVQRICSLLREMSMIAFVVPLVTAWYSNFFGDPSEMRDVTAGLDTFFAAHMRKTVDGFRLENIIVCLDSSDRLQRRWIFSTFYGTASQL